MGKVDTICIIVFIVLKWTQTRVSVVWIFFSFSVFCYTTSRKKTALKKFYFGKVEEVEKPFW
jgi:hypothetical protein